MSGGEEGLFFLSLYKFRLRLWTEQKMKELLSPTPGRAVTEEQPWGSDLIMVRCTSQSLPDGAQGI